MNISANTPSQAQANCADVVQAGLPALSRTILLVEDETFVREVAFEVLCAAGYEVIAAKSADEATRCYDLQNGAVDLLLTDVVLPDENGLIMAKALRERNPSLRVLFVTGYAEHMNRGLRQDELLEKPFSKGSLLERVRRMLNPKIADAYEDPLSSFAIAGRLHNLRRNL